MQGIERICAPLFGGEGSKSEGNEEEEDEDREERETKRRYELYAGEGAEVSLPDFPT